MEKLIQTLRSRGYAKTPDAKKAEGVYSSLKSEIKGLVTFESNGMHYIVSPKAYSRTLTELRTKLDAYMGLYKGMEETFAGFKKMIDPEAKPEAKEKKPEAEVKTEPKDDLIYGPECSGCKKPIFIKSKDKNQLEGQTAIPDGEQDVCVCATKPCKTC